MPTAAIRFKLVLACALALAGCEAAEQPREAPGATAEAQAGHCTVRAFEETRFTVCRYDARAHRIELVVDGDSGPLRSFEALERHLGERMGSLLFAMNAGMYDAAGRPIGLYVEQAERQRRINLRDGPGNFHMKPNGVFAVSEDGRVSILTSDVYARRNPSPMWATQSGPMLVIGGRIHPRISPDGESRLVRNGVGVSDPRTAWFVISDAPVSFGRFARFFRDALGCRDALFLDGTVSSLWDPAAGRRDGYDRLGPLVLIFRRNAL